MEENADLLASLELAAQALINAQEIAGLQVFTGQSSSDKPAPCVICAAGGEPEEDPPFSGNFWVDLVVASFYPAAIDTDGVDPKPLSDAQAKAVFLPFKSQTLPADINALDTPNFTVQAARVGVPSFEASGDELANKVMLRVYCCASTLAP